MRAILSVIFFIVFNLFFIFSSSLLAVDTYTDKASISQAIEARKDLNNDSTIEEVQELLVRYLFLCMDETESFAVKQNLYLDGGKKGKFLHGIYKKVFPNLYDLIKKMIELDVEGKYIKYILVSKIPNEVYNDPFLKNKLQNSFIREFLFPWIDEKKQFIEVKGENEGLNFSYIKIFGNTSYIGLFDRLEDLIRKVFELDVEEKYIKYIIASKIPTGIYENEVFRQKLTRSFIKDFVFPWIDKNKRFPQVKDYRVEDPSSVGVSIVKFAHMIHIDGFDGAASMLINKVVEYDTEEKYLKYILGCSFIPKESLENEYVVEKLRKSFIKDFLIPWLDINKRWPDMADFKEGQNSVGVTHRVFDNYFGMGIFDSFESLIVKMIEMNVDNKYFKYILECNIYPDLYSNENIRKKLQEVFIKEYLMPWIESNNGLFRFDLDFTKDRVGFSHSKIFNHKGMRLFDSSMEMIRRALEIDNSGIFLQHLLKRHIFREWYNDEYIRKALQVGFVREYIFKWFEENRELVNEEKNFSIDSIDYSRHKIFGYRGFSGIFDSSKQIIEKIIEVDTEEKYVKYILYLNIPKECYRDSNLRKKIQEIFVKHYMFPWMEKHKSFPSTKDYGLDNDMGILYTKIMSRPGILGLFTSTKELLERVIELDPEGKYLRYILGSRISREAYLDENIRQVLQEIYIEKHFKPWIEKEGRRPRYIDFENEDLLYVGSTRIFSNEKEETVGIFDDVDHLKRTYVSLYLNDDNRSKDLCRILFSSTR